MAPASLGRWPPETIASASFWFGEFVAEGSE